MRITRLHLWIAAIGMTCLVFGVLSWMEESELSFVRAPKEPSPAVSQPRPTSPNGDAAKTIATVGEAYQSLRKHYGDIPTVSGPLRTAKEHFAQGHTEQALASARSSW